MPSAFGSHKPAAPHGLPPEKKSSPYSPIEWNKCFDTREFVQDVN